MKKIDFKDMENLQGGVKSAFTNGQGTAIGLACGIGLFVVVAASGGLAVPAALALAGAVGGGAACGVGLADWAVSFF